MTPVLDATAFRRAASLESDFAAGRRPLLLLDALDRVAEGKQPDGMAGEFSGEISRALGLPPGGLFIPGNLLCRDLSAGIGGSGGVTVQTAVGPTAAGLRPHSRCVAAGATVLSGLTSIQSLPVAATAPRLAWKTEGAPASPSDLTFGQVVLVPVRAAGYMMASRQLLAQGRGAEETILNELRAAAGEILDQGAVVGSGAGGQPTGILNTSGIGTVTFGGAATWPKVLEFEAAVARLNADSADGGTMGFLASAATREKWRAKERAAGSGFLWDAGTVADRPALCSEHLAATNRVVYGRWSELLLAVWALEVLGDVFTASLTGHVRFACNLICGVAVRRPQSFAVSTDSGAQ